MAQSPSSLNKKYTLQGTLKGHHGAILCLRASDNGKILASGGMDGVNLWSLQTMTAIEGPCIAGLRGATTALVWIRREDEPGEILFYGTQNGHLVCWKQSQNKDASDPFEEVHCVQLASPSEITGLVFDAVSNHLVMCNRNSVIQLFTIDGLMQPWIVFSVTIADFLPKAIAFGHMSGDNRTVLAFGLHDGQIHTLRGSDRKVEHTRSIGGMIGDAAVNSRKGVFCIDEPAEGVALHRLDTGARIRTFPIAITRSQRPRQVCFAEDCSVIVSGSDHGVVYIFDRRSGDKLDELRIDPDDWAQTVMATDVDGVSTILAAKSRDIGGDNPIFVWKKCVGRPKERDAEAPSRILKSIKIAFQVVMYLGTIAFMYQNLKLDYANMKNTMTNLLGRKMT